MASNGIEWPSVAHVRFANTNLWTLEAREQADEKPSCKGRDGERIDLAAMGVIQAALPIQPPAGLPHPAGRIFEVTVLPHLGSSNLTPVDRRWHVAPLGESVRVGLAVEEDGRVAVGTVPEGPHWLTLVHRVPSDPIV
eukprot:5196215-Prymnesium_polylepis.1